MSERLGAGGVSAGRVAAIEDAGISDLFSKAVNGVGRIRRVDAAWQSSWLVGGCWPRPDWLVVRSGKAPWILQPLFADPLCAAQANYVH